MTPPIPYSVTRAERARMVADLRAQGLTYRQVAETLGITPTYVRDLVSDPTGEKHAARVRSYQGVCEDCGEHTWGGGGRRNAPKVCARCFRARRAPEHGTRSRYRAGCSCDDCRAANRAAGRALKGKPPPNHGYSGYQNYGCRCQVCRDGFLVYKRANGYEAQKRYAQRKRQERKRQESS